MPVSFLKYTDHMPAEFGGYAVGPFILIRPRYRHDLGLLRHEEQHVIQWYVALIMTLLLACLFCVTGHERMAGLTAAWSPFMHSALYMASRWYRLRCEVSAFRRQLECYGPRADRGFAVSMLYRRYDLGISLNQAHRLLS